MQKIALIGNGMWTAMRNGFTGAALSLFAALLVLTGLAAPGTASAQASPYVSAAQSGLTQASTDASTVGGYVITAVLVVVAVLWVLSMIKRK